VTTADAGVPESNCILFCEKEAGFPADILFPFASFTRKYEKLR
jgi:hypothetical protein